MKPFFVRFPLCIGLACGAMLSNSASATLVNYWPVNETSGTTLANTAGGTIGVLNGGTTFATDPVRGQVLQFNADGYVDAGVLPQMTTTNDFTWSFWVMNQTDPVALPNQVILGNRYMDSGTGDFTPREFTKFTPTQFEYHHDGVGENTEYRDLQVSADWVHLAVVKQGNHFFSYQNGVLQSLSLITAGQNNPQPLFFGGNGLNEMWSGQMDDIATWTDALPASSVSGLAKGKYTPTNAPITSTPPPPPTFNTIFSDDFSSGLTKWTSTNRGLENNAPAGYDPPTTAAGQVVLSGTSNAQYWYGNSIESNQHFSSSLQSTVSVDRVSLTGTGTAFRSSLWVLGDDGHYLHFSQNVGENGWSWNARDDGGGGDLNPTGSGTNIGELDALDGDLGSHVMKIEIVPLDVIGSVNMFMYLDDTLVAGHGFTNFPSEFSIVLTGQGRAGGDTVSAVFDNVVVQQVPEPTTAALVLLGGLAGMIRRRR